MDARRALAQLRALERWVDEACAVHPRPYVMHAAFAREAADVVRSADGDPRLAARIELRLARLRERLHVPGA